MNSPLMWRLIISQKSSRGGERHPSSGNQLEILCFPTLLPPCPPEVHLVEGMFLAELINPDSKLLAGAIWDPEMDVLICLGRMDL